MEVMGEPSRQVGVMGEEEKGKKSGLGRFWVWNNVNGLKKTKGK